MKTVFIVGCPAAGKSTLAKLIHDRYRQFDIVSDLQALSELFEINDTITRSIQEKWTLEQAYASLKELYGRICYWRDTLNVILASLEASDDIFRYINTSLLLDGGHDILSPSVWDDALSRVVKLHDLSEHLILEFSRGVDERYQHAFGISERDVYLRAFQIIFDTNPRMLTKSLIIHLHVNHTELMFRNQLRKIAGKHYVSETVMETVYSHDVFNFICAPNGVISGYFSKDLPIPVISLSNENPDYETTFAPIIDHMAKFMRGN